ncbi:MAG: iron ABC transporter permease, partial [Candidatus Accumulibacter sp.]|nr:iron ABC transporter permease [Accumulibacter sp.]
MTSGTRGRTGACLLLAILLSSVLVSLSLGRFGIPLKTVAGILLEPLFDIQAFWSHTEAQVVWAVRSPRVALAAVVGAGLALAGASLQSLFRNPLADPQILGVSSGAALGGVIGILVAGTGWPAISGSFAGGIASLAFVFWLAGGTGAGRGSAVMLVLAGLVVGAVGAAGIALVKYAADP